MALESALYEAADTWDAAGQDARARKLVPLETVSRVVTLLFSNPFGNTTHGTVCAVAKAASRRGLRRLPSGMKTRSEPTGERDAFGAGL
jgi:hypothetical protein